MKIEIKYKLIGHSFIASWFHFKIYPRFWHNVAKDTPNFKHWSWSIRWLWWMFGIERKYKTIYSEEETYLFNLERNQPERNTEYWKNKDTKNKGKN